MVSLRSLPLYPARTEGIRSFHHQKASPEEILAFTKYGPSPPHHNGKLASSRGKLNQLPQDCEVGTDPRHPWRHCWHGNKSTLLLCSPRGSASLSGKVFLAHSCTKCTLKKSSLLFSLLLQLSDESQHDGFCWYQEKHSYFSPRPLLQTSFLGIYPWSPSPNQLLWANPWHEGQDFTTPTLRCSQQVKH